MRGLGVRKQQLRLADYPTSAFLAHRQGPPMLTAEDVVKRIAVGCAFVETGAPWAFG
jgi:hypothetical protein